jgi:Leucine-rich repeat (LRR) protein
MNGEKMPSLVKIELNNNKITDEGLITLTENGKNLPNLDSLSLNNNQITDKGFIFFC